MFKPLLIDTVTINDFTQTNNKGTTQRTPVALHTNIPSRINDLSFKDRKFFEEKEEYTSVTKKAFVEAKYTGIKIGMLLVHDSVEYRIVEIKTRKDSTKIHHYELYLDANEAKPQ